MGRRLDLQTLLESILGSRNVYFQPPSSIRMEYPCIIYHLSSIQTKYADDFAYHHRKRYDVIIVDLNPDSQIPDRVGELELASFGRQYVADNLYHTVYTLYF